MAIATSAPALAQSGETASVVAARGGLRGAIAPSTSWEDVGPGVRVKAGDTLKTAAGASAELLFGDGGRLALGENAIVKLQEQGGLGGRLLTGRARVTAPPEGVTTLAAGNLRLTGTDAEAVIEKAGSAWRVAVLAGSFRVAEAGKAPVAVEAGRSAIFGGGAAEPRVSVITRGAWQDLQAGFGPDAGGPAPAATGGAPRAAGGADKWIAAGLSALLPGSGQLYAGEIPRGLLYLGAEFALLGTGFYGVFYGQRNLAMYAGAGLLGLNLISPIDAVFTMGNGPAATSAASLPTSLTTGPADDAPPLLEIRHAERATAFRP